MFAYILEAAQYSHTALELGETMAIYLSNDTI